MRKWYQTVLKKGASFQGHSESYLILNYLKCGISYSMLATYLGKAIDYI